MTIASISSTLRFLIWAGVLLFLNFVLITALRAADRRAAFTTIIGATAILNIAANAFLIPRYDHLGAALAMIISESFFFISAFCYIWVKICRPYGLRSNIKVILASLLTGVILSTIKGNVSPTLLLAISMALYGVTVYALVIKQ
jgi:O-antigen/teichoic acid export membrane protein